MNLKTLVEEKNKENPKDILEKMEIILYATQDGEKNYSEIKEYVKEFGKDLSFKEDEIKYVLKKIVEKNFLSKKENTYKLTSKGKQFITSRES